MESLRRQLLVLPPTGFGNLCTNTLVQPISSELQILSYSSEQNERRRDSRNEGWSAHTYCLLSTAFMEFCLPTLLILLALLLYCSNSSFDSIHPLLAAACSALVCNDLCISCAAKKNNILCSVWLFCNSALKYFTFRIVL